MAETSLSLEELVRKLMGDDHADILRETLGWFVRELMEAEVAAQIGAGLHERSPERTTQRNGYRERAWATRAGEIALAIPRLRSRLLLPELLRAPQPQRAGPGGRRPGGLRQRRVAPARSIAS